MAVDGNQRASGSVVDGFIRNRIPDKCRYCGVETEEQGRCIVCRQRIIGIA